MGLYPGGLKTGGGLKVGFYGIESSNAFYRKRARVPQACPQLLARNYFPPFPCRARGVFGTPSEQLVVVFSF